MSTQNHQTTLLLTEHFRQTPLSLLDEIINTVNELVFKAIDRLEEALTSAPPDVLGYELPVEQTEGLDDAAYEATLAQHKQKEIEVGIVQLESLLNAIVDKNFDKFEIWALRNSLAVGHEEDADLAQWIRLEHYKDLSVEADSSRITPQEIQLQRRKKHETAKLNVMLKEEQAKNAAIIEELQTRLSSGGESPLGFLAAQPTTNTSQSMAHLVAQLPAIKTFLADLQTMLSRPASTRPSESAIQRRQYLNAQSIAALEHRGLSAESQHAATVMDKSISRDEVEGLEAVVQALAGAEMPD